MKIESRDGYNYVELTKQEAKDLIKTPIGGSFQGAFVLKHKYKSVLKNPSVNVDEPLDEVLDVIGYTYQVAFVFDGKLFANRVDIKINEDKTEWFPALDRVSFNQLNNDDTSGYYYTDGFNVIETEYL